MSATRTFEIFSTTHKQLGFRMILVVQCNSLLNQHKFSHYFRKYIKYDYYFAKTLLVSGMRTVSCLRTLELLKGFTFSRPNDKGFSSREYPKHKRIWGRFRTCYYLVWLSIYRHICWQRYWMHTRGAVIQCFKMSLPSCQLLVMWCYRIFVMCCFVGRVKHFLCTFSAETN